MGGVRSRSPRSAALHDRAPAGSTLMDLLLTITLISILGAIGIPILYPSLVEFRLLSASEQVLGAVEYAHSRAVISGTKTRVISANAFSGS